MTALALEAVRVDAWDARAREPRTLLRDVTWQVRAGEHWAILGPNGAGKTTVLRTVAGILSPVRGAVSVLGRRVGTPGMRDPRTHLGFIESTPRTFASPPTRRNRNRGVSLLVSP